jgi:hypothetical protein
MGSGRRELISVADGLVTLARCGGGYSWSGRMQDAARTDDGNIFITLMRNPGVMIINEDSNGRPMLLVWGLALHKLVAWQIRHVSKPRSRMTEAACVAKC